MKIVLLKEAKNLGHKGDIKEVSDGYARNFLIPNGVASIANDHIIKVLEAQKTKKKKKKPAVKKEKSNSKKKTRKKTKKKAKSIKI
jgi:large subunit ribosomal protein L9